MSWIKVISINFLVLLGITLAAEGVLRVFVDFQSDYYFGQKKSISGSINFHPYGNVPINSKGFYDQEWESPKTKHRKAYFGDSVAYGVGAGYPFRITEYLDDFEKKIEHVNISGGLDASMLTLGTSDEIIQLVKNNEIDSIVYLMNLNDIPPLAYSSNIDGITNTDTSQNLLKIKSFISNIFNPALRFVQCLHNRSINWV